MPKFIYKVVTEEGGVRTGSAEAETAEEVRQSLLESGLQVESIHRERRGEQPAPSSDVPLQRFYFRVMERETRKVKRGSIEAPDLESARQALELRDMKIEEIGPEEEEAPPEEPVRKAPRAGTWIKASPERAARRVRLPKKLRTPAALPQDQQNVLIVALLVVGLLLLVSTLAMPRHDAALKVAKDRVPVEVVVSGRLWDVASSSGASPDGLEVVFHFPDIPLDLQRSGPQLKLSERGDFKTRFTFQARSLPRFVSLTVRKPGYSVARSGRAMLTGVELLQGAVPRVDLTRGEAL